MERHVTYLNPKCKFKVGSWALLCTQDKQRPHSHKKPLLPVAGVQHWQYGAKQPATDDLSTIDLSEEICIHI